MSCDHVTYVTVTDVTSKLCLCDMFVTVTCDITFCLLHLYPNKKRKRPQNKIKEKGKGK